MDRRELLKKAGVPAAAAVLYGSRAEAANQALTPPMLLTVTSSAANGATGSRPIRPATLLMACMNPCKPLTSSVGNAINTVNVAVM